MLPNLHHPHQTTRGNWVDGMKTEETFLTRRDHLGMMVYLSLCLNQEMKVGQQAVPVCLHVENTSLKRMWRQWLPCYIYNHVQGVDCNLVDLGPPSRSNKWFSFSKL